MAQAEEDQKHLAAFGQRVKQLRLSSDLTQEDVAERAGVDPRLIRFVETGTREVGLATVWSIARGLAVEPADLFLNTLPETERT
jgi:transcriptional regulator with XRE-family HTH domain